jgi:UDP-N-acetylglucosamine--N-acetylmuramyl-(pentapeptide) pyrophosphoryl-undecaprenol N-acetylglucosamine transferase
MSDLRPAAVVGFGGYPSIPTVLAAILYKIPIVLHEQNALLGRANRRLAKRAAAIATSFETVSGLPAHVKAVLTGNPVRPAILATRDRPYVPPVADRQFTIFVLGGSQGARIFSEVIPAAVALLPAALRGRLHIVQQCRPEDIESAGTAFRKAGVSAELSTFFNDVPERLAACNLVIGRSGASTIAELGVAGRPAILVPYPFATDDHQTVNANSYVRNGAGWVLGQRTFIPLLLAERIESLSAQPDQLVRAAQAAWREGRPDAAERLADITIAHIKSPSSISGIKDVAA